MRDPNLSREIAYIQAEGLVTLVFTAGSHALDMNQQQRLELKKRLMLQLRMLIHGATSYAHYAGHKKERTP